jgi:Bifunctional DNA primase/polymerase, N-terminal
MTVMTTADVRLAMWRNGYAPIPCRGKHPSLKEWQRHHETNPLEMELWDRLHPYDTNTGCLARSTPTLDVDITDRDACVALLRHIREQFREDGVVLCRIGNAPKFATFRADAPFRKITAKVTAPSGAEMKLEFLGDGQQFIVHGVHPDTHAPYRWWPAGRDLTTVPRNALPRIDEAGARALVDDLVALLLCDDFGFTLPKKPERTAVARASAPNAPHNPGLIRHRLDGLIVLVARSGEGNRNSVLFWAASRVNDMIMGGHLDDETGAHAIACLHEAASRTGLSPREIERTIKSAAKPAPKAAPKAPAATAPKGAMRSP